MPEIYELDESRYERVTFGCCGVTVFLPEVFLPERRKTGKTFYCPNGHPRVFMETELDKAKKELEAVKKRFDVEHRRVEDVKTGKCPWCFRTVKNLSGHIQRRHR